jgi:hypothetical protein
VGGAKAVAEDGAEDGAEASAKGGALQAARIVDEGGPLALQAQLELEPSGGWQLQGTVAARSAPSPVLAGLLQLLGPADAAGLRQFSIAGRP